MTSSSKAAQMYQGMHNMGAATEASSHKLITMLFDGVIERLVSAKGAMERGDAAVKGTLISKAINIIDGLRAHLDHEKGKEIAQNLSLLYDYMENKLFEANLKNDTVMLDEVLNLIRSIRSAWVAIDSQVA